MRKAVLIKMSAVSTQPALPAIMVESLYRDQEKPHRYRLLEPVAVTLSNGQFILIEAGFVTDFATVPRLLWGVVATHGRHNAATLIHDYLYVNKYTAYGQPHAHADRLFADREMLYWLHLTDQHFFSTQKPPKSCWQKGRRELERLCMALKAQLMYRAVRLGGKKWWFKRNN